MTAEEQGKSEIARLRAQIVEEYQAAKLGAQGLAAGARHAFIRQRMQRIEQPFQQLTTELGSQAQAIALVADALAQDSSPPAKKESSKR